MRIGVIGCAGRMGRANLREVLTTDGVALAGGVLRAVAVAGAGITMLPTFVVGDELRAGRLVEVLRDWPMAGLEERAVWAVYPSNRAIPPKVRAFVDFLAARIGDPPYWDRDL